MKSMLGIAIAIASEGFKDKVDKAGKPYILHCLKVYRDIHSDNDNENCAAVLHDCVEDKVCTIADLAKYGFTERTIELVMKLTHSKSISYDDYIKSLASDTSAVKIKMADLRHNSNITRLKGLTKKDFDRIEKYHRSYVYLSSVVNL